MSNAVVLTSGLTEPPFWWQWPTILSLDAPLVALVWQSLLARGIGLELPWPPMFVLAMSVWLAYAADRWIEGWRVDARLIRTHRHLFYSRRRHVVAAIWCVALAADLLAAFTRLSSSDLVTGALLLVPVLAYLLSHQLIHRHHPWRAPKEVLTAALLTGGVLVFLQPWENGSRLGLPLALFALLCFVNCALISRWERDVDLAHGQTSLAVPSARRAVLIRWLPWFAVLLMLVAWRIVPGWRTASLCAAVSAGLLGLLDRSEHVMGWRLTRVLADAALLTPLVPLLFGP